MNAPTVNTSPRNTLGNASMNAAEFLDVTLRPTLMAMGMHSPAAEKLLLMTACHESGGFKYKKQLGDGPARSYYQIEPATLFDLYDNYLKHRPTRRELLGRFEPEFAFMDDDQDEPWQDQNTLAEWLSDDIYATAAARMIYARVSAALPAADTDDIPYAAYWKQFWNTSKGKGTVEKCLTDWEHYKPEGYVPGADPFDDNQKTVGETTRQDTVQAETI